MARPPTFQFFKPRNTLLLVGTISLCLAVPLGSAVLVQIGVGCFAAALVAFVQAWGLLREVDVRRQHQERAFQGSSLAVDLYLANLARRPAELVSVEDSFPPASGGRVRRLLEEPLVRGTVTEIGYIGSCDHRRGLYVLGPVKLQAYDPLGFFPNVVQVDCLTKLLVYPLAVDLRQTDLLGEGVLAHVGLEVKPRPGVGEEFLGVREYRHGDPPRRVHWRSTAHHGTLMVKEFEEEITTLVTFFVDLGKMGLVGIGDQTSVEYGIRSCASMAKRAVELGHRVQFFGVGKTVEHIGPGAGTAHLLTVLDRLALVRAEGESAFPIVVRDLVRELPRGSTAVLILGAATIDIDIFRTLVSLLVDRRVLPVFVLIDDRAFIKVFREQEDRHINAPSLEEVSKELTLMGARVHIVRRSRSMEQSLAQALEREEATL